MTMQWRCISSIRSRRSCGGCAPRVRGESKTGIRKRRGGCAVWGPATRKGGWVNSKRKVPRPRQKVFIEVKRTRTRLDCTRSIDLQNYISKFRSFGRGRRSWIKIFPPLASILDSLNSDKTNFIWQLNIWHPFDREFERHYY